MIQFCTYTTTTSKLKKSSYFQVLTTYKREFLPAIRSVTWSLYGYGEPPPPSPDPFPAYLYGTFPSPDLTEDALPQKGL